MTDSGLSTLSGASGRAYFEVLNSTENSTPAGAQESGFEGPDSLDRFRAVNAVKGVRRSLFWSSKQY